MDADTLLTGVSDDIMAMTAAGGRIANDAAELSARVRSGQGTVGRFFADDQLYREATELTGEARATVQNLRRVTEQAARAIDAAGEQRGAVSAIAGNLQTTLVSTQTAMTNLAEATEAMKHNFLLRGFFKNRGYFSLSELSSLEYRQGALEREGRRALRIWVPASRLFETSAEGLVVLTDEGRARLDSAMGEFLKYREARADRGRGPRAGPGRGGAVPDLPHPRGRGARLPRPEVRARPHRDRPDGAWRGASGGPASAWMGRHRPGGVRGPAADRPAVTETTHL